MCCLAKIARRPPGRGRDWTQRFNLIARAVPSLRCQSCLVDGEAVVCDDEGIPDFKLLVRNRKYGSAQLYAFDLLELDGEDLRSEPIERANMRSSTCWRRTALVS
jgi:ATP-dependent DNA ligase